MSIEGRPLSYPGAQAGPVQILQLADEYRRAAHALLSLGRRGKPLSRAPFRLVAIHSVELCLNALLLAKGHSPADVRGLQHNMAARTDAAIASGLKLKKLTALHLRRLSETREYLMARYDPELSAASEITRMKATLDEVATKVAAVVRSARTCSIPAPQVNQAPPKAKAT